MKLQFCQTVVPVTILLLAGLPLRAAEPINAMCPVTPEELAETSITTEYHGKTIGFCCKSCLRKFNQDPIAYVDQLNPNPEHPKTDHHASVDSEHVRGHDHTKDHQKAETDSTLNRLLVTLGKLHVLVVHLPIGFLPFAGLFELIGLKMHSPTWRFTAKVNFIFGASSALVAAGFGWIAAEQSIYSEELAELLFFHRWLGISVASLSLLGLLGLFIQSTYEKVGALIYRIIVFLLAILVPLTAHFGGSLIYGTNYLF
jgi:uncharacterized membrane protein/YHS domain-containing protein